MRRPSDPKGDASPGPAVLRRPNAGEPAAEGTRKSQMQESINRWSARRYLIGGALALAILVGGFGGWATFTQIAGAVIASGQIQVDQNRQVVQHLDGGVVSEIMVDEGDAVDAGDLLIRLDGTLLTSELTIIQGQLYEMMARRGRLEAERGDADAIAFPEELLQAARTDADAAELIAGQERLFEARLDALAQEVEQLAKRRSQIENQIDGIEAQQAALTRQQSLLQEELQDQQQLHDQGLAQKSRVLALQREDARLGGTLGELQASKAENEGRITELEVEILKLKSDRRTEAITTLRDLQYREYELAEQRRALQERISRLEVRAPVGGIVYDMQVHARRSVIRAADPILHIIPQDRPLLMATRIDSIHVDRVFPGQEVVLRFSAFDTRTTPELLGTIRQISADAFTDENTGVSYYRAEIVLQEGQTNRLPEDTILLPGMPVEAFIRTADRTPLAYLLKPLSDYFARAFRES